MKYSATVKVEKVIPEVIMENETLSYPEMIVDLKEKLKKDYPGFTISILGAKYVPPDDEVINI